MRPTKIAILGNSGSGKSTLAGRLASALNFARLDLDPIAFQPDQPGVLRDRADAVADVLAFCNRSADGWVIEGCYAGLIEAALPLHPLLIFLDPGVAQCQANCRTRPWEPHKYASREDQDANLEMLLQWVADYETRDGEMGRRGHVALYDRATCDKQRVEARAEIDVLVARLTREST